MYKSRRIRIVIIFSIILLLFVLAVIVNSYTQASKCETYTKTQDKLAIFVISHQGNKKNDKLLKDPRYILVTGGHTLKNKLPYILKDNHLKLNCFDTYAALPEKVILTINAFVNLKQFKNYTYMYKVDSDVKPFAFNEQKIAEGLKKKGVEYGGFHQIYGKEDMPLARNWHLKYAHQHEKNTKWSQPYTGRYPENFFQGSQYILSKSFAEEIALIYNYDNIDLVTETDIYEDVMMGKLALLLNRRLTILENKFSIGCIKQIKTTCRST